MLTVIAATAAALTLAVTFYIFQFQAANQAKRTAVLASLGISPSRNVKILGFFHPYWCDTHTRRGLSRLTVV